MSEDSIDPISALEAILFVTEAPVPPAELAEVLEIPSDDVETLIEGLAKRLVERDSGLTVRRAGGGYRLYSRADTYPYLERFSTSATLERMGLITEVGRLSVPGNPAVYGTSELFLEKMGINSLDELPPLADHVPPSEIVETLEATFKEE